MRRLIGDIGGTNTRLAIYDGATRRARRTWPSSGGLAAPLEALLAEHGPFDAACLAVAGPVFGGRTLLTNLGWELDAAELTARLGCPTRLINDFHAQALAVTRLDATQRLDLPPTRPADRAPGDCIAVLGAGTGLGEAILTPDGRGGWIAIPGEGSHKRFGPQNPRQIALLEAFWARYGDHVSVERVVSGPGLVAIYDVLRGAQPRHPAMAEGSVASVITTEALRPGGCPICVETVDLFVDVFADEAGALALQCNAGAVWIGGGIAPRIVPIIQRRFRRAFEGKGRYRSWLQTVPIHLMDHPDPGLLGALIACGG